MDFQKGRLSSRFKHRFTLTTNMDFFYMYLCLSWSNYRWFIILLYYTYMYIYPIVQQVWINRIVIFTHLHQIICRTVTQESQLHFGIKEYLTWYSCLSLDFAIYIILKVYCKFTEELNLLWWIFALVVLYLTCAYLYWYKFNTCMYFVLCKTKITQSFLIH